MWKWIIGGGLAVWGLLSSRQSSAQAQSGSASGGGGNSGGSNNDRSNGSSTGGLQTVYAEWRHPTSGQLRQMHMPTTIQRLGKTITNYEDQELTGFWMANNYATSANLVQFYLREGALQALEQAQLVVTREGGSILMTDAYRSWDVQMQAYQNKPDLAVHPSKSNHPRGLAIDVKVYGITEERMTQILAQYGWRATVPSEPWHFDYLA